MWTRIGTLLRQQAQHEHEGKGILPTREPREIARRIPYLQTVLLSLMLRP